MREVVEAERGRPVALVGVGYLSSDLSKATVRQQQAMVKLARWLTNKGPLLG